MKRIVGWLLALVLFLGGCAWFTPPEPTAFPEQIVPGWTKQVEVALDNATLPTGSLGGWGVVWGGNPRWIVAEIVYFPSAGEAHARFNGVVGTVEECETTPIGEEGIAVLHEASGLAVHIFRSGRTIALVGSLAESAENAPPHSLLEDACLALAAHIATASPPGVAALDRMAATRSFEPSSLMTDVQVPLNLGEQRNGTMTIGLEAIYMAEKLCNCTYVMKAYIRSIAVGDDDGDGWPRGAGDVFAAGIIDLAPYGRIQFQTGELCDIDRNTTVTFADSGRILTELNLTLPCWKPSINYSVSAIVRDSDDADALDLCFGAVKAIAVVYPEAAPYVNTVDTLRQTHGVQETVDPATPIADARNVNGNTIGEGTASGAASLPGPEIVVVDQTLCRDTASGNPVQRTQVFACGEEQVVSWIQLAGICRDPVTIRWDWVQGESTVRSHEVQVGPTDAVNGVVTQWDALPLGDCGSMAGGWQVEIRLNGEKKVVLPFLVQPTEIEVEYARALRVSDA